MGVNYNLAIVNVDSNASVAVLSMTAEEIVRCAQSGIPVILSYYSSEYEEEIIVQGEGSVGFLTTYEKSDDNNWYFTFDNTMTFKCADLSEHPELNGD